MTHCHSQHDRFHHRNRHNFFIRCTATVTVCDMTKLVMMIMRALSLSYSNYNNNTRKSNRGKWSWAWWWCWWQFNVLALQQIYSTMSSTLYRSFSNNVCCLWPEPEHSSPSFTAPLKVRKFSTVHWPTSSFIYIHSINLRYIFWTLIPSLLVRVRNPEQLFQKQTTTLISENSHEISFLWNYLVQ